jgi:hypothetical protein
MSKRTRASGITLVHWETGQCTEVPYYPGMHCAVYLMHVIVDSLKGQVQIKKMRLITSPSLPTFTYTVRELLMPSFFALRTGQPPCIRLQMREKGSSTTPSV